MNPVFKVNGIVGLSNMLDKEVGRGEPVKGPHG